MTKTLGSAALQLYAGVASMFLPIPVEDQPGLIEDLEGDPFVGHALSTAVCELLVLLFVALWFILRGDLLYVFPCVILFLCFSVLLVL